jgi:hypothetical protein
MTLGLLDLSIVTDQLRDRLKDAASNFQPWLDDPMSRFDIDFTGLAPDAVRAAGTCHVSIYLFHVTADKFHRNTFPTGGAAQPVPAHPLGLVLYYLVSAYSAKSHVQEQQAMSIVLKCFHESPIVTLEHEDTEFTLTLEPQTADEAGRLWQAVSAPMRLSAMYRVSVIFIEPEQPAARGVVRRPARLVDNEVKAFRAIPAPVVLAAKASAGGRVAVEVPGGGFAHASTRARIRALPLDETTVDPPAPGQFRVVDLTHLDIQLPPYTPRGNYLVEIQPAQGRPLIELSLEVPFVAVVTADVGGTAAITVDGGGFITGTTTVSFGATPLTEVNAAPGRGEFQVVTADSLRVGIPTATPAGRYLIHVRTGADTPLPELWLEVP